MTNPSLDDILKEIEQESQREIEAELGKWQAEEKKEVSQQSLTSSGTRQDLKPPSAGMADVSAHEIKQDDASPSPLSHDVNLSGIPQLSRQMLAGSAVVSERASSGQVGSTAFRRNLPKLSYRMLGSIAAVLVLTVGLASAIWLSSQPQDLRQYAYEETATEPAVIGQPISSGGADASQTAGDSDTVAGEIVSDPNKPGQIAYVTQPEAGQLRDSKVWWRNPWIVAGATIVVSGLLLLIVFLHWLFAI